MPAIRIHGRGGQGTLSAGEIIARAAWLDGWQVQSLPFFGVERSGSPVASFIRLSREKIRTREQVKQPDIIIVQDSRLLDLVDTISGISTNTEILVNARQAQENIMIQVRRQKPNFPAKRLHTFDASGLADKLGYPKMGNTALAAWASRQALAISLRSVETAIKETFKNKDQDIIAANIKVARAVFKL
jgi:pyruvate ferredoxin oxidoreductase gamma subunit